jgi:OmcA/MtrC family decaheme c-type cytochrome
MGTEDVNFYRVMSLGETIVELEGWSMRLAVSAPTNGTYFAAGEAPVVTVTLLDTFAQGLSRADFSSLNLYMYGPQDPQKVVTAAKLLNASTDRNARPHHYIDLKTNPDVQVYNNVYTYSLKPVTAEAPGTYRIALWAVRGSDAIQQVMRFVDVQIGTATVEQPVIAKAQCAACHEGQVSGKMYLHHIDVGFSPVGNWSLDYDPDLSCASCHNNDGYAAFVDANAPGGRVPDQLVRRVHGVHMGEELKNPFNTNPTNGIFSMYTHVLFPANIKDCTSCHIDNRWKTKPSRLACGSCHDNVYFGQAPVPEGMEAHPVPVADDSGCSLCHPPDVGSGTFISVADAHEIPPPAVNLVTISMTPPVNGSFYAPGDTPKVTLQFMDDSNNAVDHTLVTDGNYSTASLSVYGPRARAVPVLTSAAKNVNSKLRASVSNNKDGPWAINGKVFRIAINGSAPQDITITGTNDLVTPAEVVASSTRLSRT